MAKDDLSFVKELIHWGNAGNEMVIMKVINILFRKGILDVTDLDEIHRDLTDFGGNYELKPYERASIERMSETFAMLRQDKD